MSDNDSNEPLDGENAVTVNDAGFSDRLKIARGTTSQRDFADLIETNQNSVMKYETGRCLPSLKTVLKIIEVTGVCADWLLGTSKETEGVEAPVIMKLKMELADKNETISTLSDALKKLKKESMKIQCKHCLSMFEIAVNARYSMHKCTKCEQINFTEVKITTSAKSFPCDVLPRRLEIETNYQPVEKNEKQGNKDLKFEFFPNNEDLYFDIETTGFSYDDHATVICWFQNGSFRFWKNNKEGTDIPTAFIDAYNNAPRVVTFNGGTFDIPRIVKWFGVTPPIVHLDIMNVAASSGINGKLKELEEIYGVTRPENIKGLKGFDIVRLWKKHIETSDEQYIETLICYCLHDVYATYAVHLGILGIPIDPFVYQNLLLNNAKIQEA